VTTNLVEAVNSLWAVRPGFGKITQENVRFTTPIQQLYNNPLHEGGPQYVGPTLM
jgi:hypothetical protein